MSSCGSVSGPQFLQEVYGVRRGRVTGILFASAALVLVGLQAPVAVAAPAKHCAIAVPADGSGAVSVRCFTTFSESIAYATKGRVRLPAGARTVTTQQLVAADAVSTKDEVVGGPLLGIDYDGTSHTGATNSYYAGSGTGCNSGASYDVDSIGSFDNKPSSARTYSNCYGRHYANTNQGGDYLNCRGSGDDNCPTLGSLNNRTSSLRFF